MAVEQVGEKYRCNVCGNEVTVTKVGGSTLICCDEDMEKIGQLVRFASYNRQGGRNGRTDLSSLWLLYYRRSL